MAENQAQRPPDWCVGKRQQILDGARKAFQELGYERASVDVIASRTGVSKATLYNHFHDKSALFVACFEQGSNQMQADLEALFAETSDDLETALQAAGERMLAKFLSREAVALYRSALDGFRLPEIGKMLYERGPRVTHELIAAALSRWAARGLLRVDDPYYAAVQFVNLCHGDVMMRLHLGVLQEASPEDVRATVRRAVQTFLRAFRP